MAITSDKVAKKGGRPKKFEEIVEPATEPEVNSSLKEFNDKIFLKMERQNASWITARGVIFTQDHPFQLVDKDEAAELFSQGFREASSEEVKAYYGGEN